MVNFGLLPVFLIPRGIYVDNFGSYSDLLDLRVAVVILFNGIECIDLRLCSDCMSSIRLGCRSIKVAMKRDKPLRNDVLPKSK